MFLGYSCMVFIKMVFLYGIPAVTSCSSSELYKRIILEFQQYVLDWPFTSVLLNNDPDLVKAVKAIFPNIELYGSWYHYCFVSLYCAVCIFTLKQGSQSNSHYICIEIIIYNYVLYNKLYCLGCIGCRIYIYIYI